MNGHLLTLAILSLLCCRTLQKQAGAQPSAGGSKNPSANMEAYQGALNTVVENINKATEKSEALINKHMSAVEKDPGALITKEAMQRLMQGSAFLPQKAGTRSLTLESQQGFNGISNYQPSGWKITETMSGPTEKKAEPASTSNQHVFTYPTGLGPVLMNGCTATEYSKTSPCYNSKLFDLQNTICTKMMDAANYIGVGFDGRGYYRAESRRASLVQRSCANRATFMGQDIPDTMNVYGIFETRAETKSFQSVDEYMQYVRNKAGLSEQKNLFYSEASKFAKASAFGFNLGGIGSLIGAGIGAVAGGPVGAAMGATAGGAIGGSISFGTGSGSGSESAKDKGQSSSAVSQSDQAATQQKSAQNFFAIMYVNVILYDISLDDVKPTDIALAAFKDYMSLPISYYSAGADVKYQNFLLRWGTHFIRSAKFGGQLTITKTAKGDKIQSAQEFASIAETEFQSMFASLQSKWSQESSSWGFLGFGGQSKQASQNSEAEAKSGYTGTMNQQNRQSQAYRQSEFTQTTVEAQGGTPEIAEALVDFYTPAFKQLFHDWIVSIKDYAKPFEFQLRPINELFNMNMDTLFPAGNTDYGCVGDGSSGKAQILVDPKTKMRYYITTFTDAHKNMTVEKKVRVNCKYSSISDFKQDMERRVVSLERAIGVYMAEGPFPTSSFEIKGGQAGCEEETMAQLALFGNSTAPLKFAELMRQPFIIAFNLPESVPGLVTMEAKYIITFRLDRWFAVEPESQLVNLYDGCQVGNVKPTDTKVCFRNIILTYEESTGLFHIERADFAASKLRIPSLPYWLAGTTVARSKKIPIPSGSGSDAVRGSQRPAIPCSVKWLNSHRMDPSKSENCIHFTAASEGDLFVVFSSVPRDHTTWYYLQISPQGVNFYHAMALQKSDLKKGMGMFGDKNLYQSFFVCIIQKAGTVTMQYGKADPDSEIGTVYSAYTFMPDSKFSLLTFYAFGTGTEPASLMDVRLTKKMPEVACAGDDYEKKDGKCILVCHVECKGCVHARNSKSCHQCKNVRTESGTGSTKVTECLSQCLPGMFPSDSHEGLCQPCTAGTYKAIAGNQKCSPCEKGTLSPEGATSCSGCPAGTFSDNTGSQRCERCSAGTFAATGATSCSVCPVGTFSEVGQAECSPCPYGHYGDKTGMSQCMPCNAGFFAATRGMRACTPCLLGSSSIRGSRSCANNCKPGEFSPTFGVACARCPPGSFSESSGSTSCSLCAAGYYQPASGQARCIISPKGTYVADRGANAYRSCSTGTFNDKEGQSSATVCRACPPGTYASNAGSAGCTKCPLGMYQPNSGRTGCLQASRGHYADVVGLASQKACPPGHHSPNVQWAGCWQCFPGYYQPNRGSADCFRTSPGHYTNVKGAASQLPCPPGYYTPHAGSTGCLGCGAGQYSPGGWTGCGTCTDFQYSRPASGSCTNCPNQSLVKSDRMNCYTKVGFSTCSASSIYGNEYNCHKAIDGSKGWPPFVSASTHVKVWIGFLSRPIVLRKIVLWRRTDCCFDQFHGIMVIFISSAGNRICGTVTSTDKPYVIIDCVHHNVVAIHLSRIGGNGCMSVAEVEAFTD